LLGLAWEKSDGEGAIAGDKEWGAIQAVQSCPAKITKGRVSSLTSRLVLGMYRRAVRYVDLVHFVRGWY